MVWRRIGSAVFGSLEYAREEQTAGLTAAFLCARYGVAPVEASHSRHYLANWLRALKADPTFLWSVSIDASKAAALVVAAAD